MAQYCSACGAEVDDEAAFCSGCGEAVGNASTEQEDVAVDTDDREGWKQYLPRSWQVGLAGVLVGLLAAFLAALAFEHIGGSGLIAMLAFLGVMGYTWQKPTGSGALGSGFWINALLLVVTPLLFYGGMLAQVSEDPQTAEEAGMAIGGVVGLFIWTFVFAIIAVVIGVVGWWLKKRESKKLQGTPT